MHHEIRARMRRRLLLSYRVDPVVTAGFLPAGLRPQLVEGWAVAGICLIHLDAVRPAWFTPELGAPAESAAHRIAVEWTEGGRVRTGVYVRARHSASMITVLGGGRLFPGPQEYARFATDESNTRFRIQMRGRTEAVAVDAHLSDDWRSELWGSAGEAVRFYENGSLGWSPRRRRSGLDALEISADHWVAEPVAVDSLRSSFFDALPAGAAEFDSALVIRNASTRWTAPHRRIDAEPQAAVARRNT